MYGKKEDILSKKSKQEEKKVVYIKKKPQYLFSEKISLYDV